MCVCVEGGRELGGGGGVHSVYNSLIMRVNMVGVSKFYKGSSRKVIAPAEQFSNRNDFF